MNLTEEKNETDEKKSKKIAKILFDNTGDNIDNDLKNPTDKRVVNSENSEQISEKIIDSANKYFLVKILSPEITNNEEKKRKHKDKLIKIVECFLVFQFFILILLMFGIIAGIFVFHGLGNDLELSYIKTIIKFISVYITSVVVELVAMLKFIVTNVFDTSITGLVEAYKESNKEN